MNVPEGLYYTEDHEWIRVEDGTGYIGITDYAQHALGDIAYVELPEVGDQFSAGDVFGVAESVKLSSDLLSPVSGAVVEVNTAIEGDPGLINQDAFGNWIVKIDLANQDELGVLLSVDGYKALIGEDE